jgi:hypothetical protein
MKRALLIILGLSLASNAWLLWSSRRASVSGAPTGAPATAAVVDRGGPATPSASGADAGFAPAESRAVSGVTWRELRTEDDYRRMADELRAAGFPSHLVYRVLQDVYDQWLRLDSPVFKAPFWQRRLVASSAAAMEHEKQREARTEQLFPDVTRAEKVDPSWRARRYGDLSLEKIAAISAIERDYSQMRRNLPSPIQDGRVLPGAVETRQQQNELLKSELRADLAKVLTPAELEAYELRSSDSAQRTARMLQDVTLTADEFSVLARARDTYDAAMNARSASPDTMRQQQEARDAYLAQLRTTLNDDRFYTALEGFDQTYRSIAALGNQFPSVTAAKAYEAMQLRNQMQAALGSLAANGPTRETIDAEFTRWNARLESVLGVEAANAFRQSPAGREFVPPAIRRGAPSATPPRG